MFIAVEKNIKFAALKVPRECPLVLLVRIDGNRSRVLEGEGNKKVGGGQCEHATRERDGEC
jgi:hypothetical protein